MEIPRSKLQLIREWGFPKKERPLRIGQQKSRQRSILMVRNCTREESRYVLRITPIFLFFSDGIGNPQSYSIREGSGLGYVDHRLDTPKCQLYLHFTRGVVYIPIQVQPATLFCITPPILFGYILKKVFSNDYVWYFLVRKIHFILQWPRNALNLLPRLFP